MTIAYDASTLGTEGTGDQHEVSHTPRGTPKAVFGIIWVNSGSGQDLVVSVTYGGQTLTRVARAGYDVVGESGQVEAEIDCGVVSIRGTVSGRIQGRQKIELLAGAKVQGTLVSPKLVIEDGAFFEGTCDMNAAAKKPALAVPVRVGGGPEGRP